MCQLSRTMVQARWLSNLRLERQLQLATADSSPPLYMPENSLEMS
jgi:hypothetical protein